MWVPAVETRKYHAGSADSGNCRVEVFHGSSPDTTPIRAHQRRFEPAPQTSRTARALPKQEPVANKEPVKPRSLVLDAGLDKLQAFLLEMSPGDELSVDRAVQISALEAEVCKRVL